MREIAPGLFHWTAFHERIRAEVSSYYASDPGVVIDPLLPADPDQVLGALASHGPPRAILLTNRHHYRHSRRLADEFGIPVRASRPGMHEFSPDQGVEPFEFGAEPVPGVVAHEVGAICPDETALFIRAARALAIAPSGTTPRGRSQALAGEGRAGTRARSGDGEHSQAHQP